MKIPIRSEVIIMLLKTLDDKDPQKTKDLSAELAISNKYLELIVASMRTAGIIRSIRGPHGGYVLSKPAEEINMLQVFRQLNIDLGSLTEIDVQIFPSVADLFKSIHHRISGYLSQINVSDLRK